jgi:hypothetical protein
MYEWAIQLATENTLPTALPYDPISYVLREGAGKPSRNILTSLTAIAAHKARNDEVNAALPILISILRARRSLPNTASTTVSTQAAETNDTPWTWDNLIGLATRLVAPPAYPSPPDDGESAPIRDAEELCEEAGLNVYIGEIIYASKSGSSSSREDGLAWTREAVDLAEEQLHKLGTDSKDVPAVKTCKECLNAGLENWAKMTAQLAREEKQRQETIQHRSSWLGLWGDGQAKAEETGRWAAEENVVKERMRRTQELLDDLEPPKSLLAAFFWA